MLIATEADLNALDAKSGDGDTGSTLAGAARALNAALDRLPLADPTQLYRAIGTELSQTMGGSSGVLLAIFFAAAGDASASGKSLIGALEAGLDRVQQVGGAKPGDRTMIDALAPALQALPESLAAAAKAARAGADKTATMTRAKAGRASYLSEDKLAGHATRGEGVARCSRPWRGDDLKDRAPLGRLQIRSGLTAGKKSLVGNRKELPRPVGDPMVPQVGQRLVRVDERQPKRIGQILLAIRHRHRIVLDHLDCGKRW